MVKAAVLGYGTVGSGVVEVLRTNRSSIARRAGDEIEVAYVLDIREFPGDPVEEILVHDYDVILEDPEVLIVAETMGGLHPAYEFTKRALESGRHVCTSNKELVAEHGTELMRIAKEHGVNYFFEASCGGGIPVIRALYGSLTADVIDEVSGILNGTTNYILSKMAEEGSDFADVLAEAQRIGYAERDPSADVDGHDARRKIAILSSLAYGQYVSYADIPTEGIAQVSATDIRYAKELGAAVKLLAVSRRTETGCFVMVCPAMIRPDSPLYAVNGVFNAVFVHGNMLGDAMFYGSGAGKLPTASAVAADIVACAMHRGEHLDIEWSEEKLELLPAGETEDRFFVRIEGSAAERLPEVREAFGDVDVVEVPGLEGEFGIVTGKLKEADYLAREAALTGVHGRFIRVFF